MLCKNMLLLSTGLPPYHIIVLIVISDRLIMPTLKCPLVKTTFPKNTTLPFLPSLITRYRIRLFWKVPDPSVPGVCAWLRRTGRALWHPGKRQCNKVNVFFLSLFGRARRKLSGCCSRRKIPPQSHWPPPSASPASSSWSPEAQSQSSSIRERERERREKERRPTE